MQLVWTTSMLLWWTAAPVLCRDAVAIGAGDISGDDTGADPPPHQDTAAMARYVIQVVDWASIATTSTRPPTRGLPFSSPVSISDGTLLRSTGVPYLYLTAMDVSVQDLQQDSRASLSASLAQTSYCRQRRYDPQSPLCAHVVLTGRVQAVNSADPEYNAAKDAILSRHPEMKQWPVGHHFFLAKLDIEHVFLLDFFGGMITVPVKDYFKADPSEVDIRPVNTIQ